VGVGGAAAGGLGARGVGTAEGFVARGGVAGTAKLPIGAFKVQFTASALPAPSVAEKVTACPDVSRTV